MDDGFYGNFSTWLEASQKTTGYNNPVILEKVKSAVLKVKSGEAAYERDSVLFDKVEYSYPLLTYLLYIASANDNKLSMMDFGGSLGTSYFQCRNFLVHLQLLKWNVVEQRHFVECGKKYIEGDNLKFYDQIEVCVKVEQPNVLLLSGVLQYLERPYQILEEMIGHGIEYIIIDRTPFIDEPDRVTVQIVPQSIYKASYPAWFFNFTRFLNCIEDQYDSVDSTDSFESYTLEDGVKAQSRIILFKKKIIAEDE
jgi:putative methyltransferase (TIGR04325 family)